MRIREKWESVERLGFAWLSMAVMLLATACLEVPLGEQLEEGPPPGWIGGDIPSQYRGLRNPFGLGDATALAAGEQLYHSHDPSCATCHGNDGRGSGPMAPYLEPSPADFAAPSMLYAFREHQDYVFWWVSDGVAETPMPAWKDIMSETERWQVITYAWQLGEQGAQNPSAGTSGQPRRSYRLPPSR